MAYNAMSNKFEQRLILQGGKPVPVLFWAVLSDRADRVQSILDAGADATITARIYRSKDGNTDAPITAAQVRGCV